MKGNIILNVGIMMLSLSSCFFGRSTKEAFQKTAYCFTGNNSGLNNKIKLNGYYELVWDFNEIVTDSNGVRKKISKGQSSFRYIFYPEGLAIAGYSRKMNAKLFSLGSYQLKGDTIKLMFTDYPGSQIHPLQYTWFLILNDSTMKYMGWKMNADLDNEILNRYQSGIKRDPNSEVVYHPMSFTNDSIPAQNRLWIRKKKWFWCSDDLYKSWKMKK